jgi:hypothetical protein
MLLPVSSTSQSGPDDEDERARHEERAEARLGEHGGYLTSPLAAPRA